MRSDIVLPAVIVQKGDTLWGIAEREIGDPQMWRYLAAINKIKNPDMISIGDIIVIGPAHIDVEGPPIDNFHRMAVQRIMSVTAAVASPSDNTVRLLADGRIVAEINWPELYQDLMQLCMGPRH